MTDSDGMGALGEQLRAMTAERAGDQAPKDTLEKPTPIAAPPLPTFTRAQLRDTEFFRANKDAILAAQRDGRITN